MMYQIKETECCYRMDLRELGEEEHEEEEHKKGDTSSDEEDY